VLQLKVSPAILLWAIARPWRRTVQCGLTREAYPVNHIAASCAKMKLEALADGAKIVRQDPGGV
jgi:hypothetical protein